MTLEPKKLYSACYLIYQASCIEMENIVIISQNRPFLGAQIVHLPLINFLKAKYPKSKIYFFSKSKISKALLPLGCIDHLIIERSKGHFLEEYRKINADLTINLRKQSLWHFWIVALFAKGKKVGFSSTLTKLFYDQTSHNNVSIYRANNYLSLIDEVLAHENKVGKKQVCIIPGAGQKHKIWDLNNYLKVAQKIQENYPDIEVVFLLGEKEADYKHKLTQFTVHINMNLEQLYHCIGQSLLVIANDCGPSHLAHIQGIDMVSLFSNERLDAQSTIDEWYHKRAGAKLIQSDAYKSINTISVNQVLDDVHHLLAKSYQPKLSSAA
jgi:ADP-heptose:LPS heptosyltransferase